MDALLGGPALLVVHGFTGSIHGSFAFESDVVHGFHQAYAGRTLAFDHPTLATSPLEDLRWLVPAGRAERYEAVVERLRKAAETIPGG